MLTQWIDSDYSLPREDYPIFPQTVEPEWAEISSFGMNTPITGKAAGWNAQAALDDALAEIVRLEALLSRFRPGSDIHRINQSAGRGPVDISPETMTLLLRAGQIGNLTNGNFNILVGPLIELWDYKHAVSAPAQASIEAVLPLLNRGDLVLDSTRGRAGLRKKGQQVDLGGIAKGYAGDCCLRILRNRGIGSAFINIGGNVAALGCKPDGMPWSVGIRHPLNPAEVLGAVAVSDCSVVTSGDYERCFQDRNGKRYHHILDPRSGYPTVSGLTSATVVAGDGLVADALSTALFVAGLDRSGTMQAERRQYGTVSSSC